MGEYCAFVRDLYEGTTMPLEEALESDRADKRGSVQPADKRGSVQPRRASTLPSAHDTRRRWRHAYPRDVGHDEAASHLEQLRMALLGATYCQVVPTTWDEGRCNALQREAAQALRAWVTQHGSGFEAKAPPTIGTPADLMMALLNSGEAAAAVVTEITPDDASGGMGKQSPAESWDALLSWISDDIGHEVSDDASRGRLVSLYRMLDANQDGRISADDLVASLRLAGKSDK